MTLPAPVWKPAFNVTRASHVVLSVRDLRVSRQFYTEVIGLIVTREDDDALYLRGIEEACHHSLGQTACPTPIIGKHPKGFEHFAMLAAMRQITTFQHMIKRGAQRIQCGFKPLLFLCGIIGDQILHNHTRLMQHHMPETHAFRQSQSAQIERTPDRDVGAGSG